MNNEKRKERYYKNIEVERERSRKYYYSHKEKAKQRKKLALQRYNEWFRSYKNGLRCERCGYCKNPQILHFHHLDMKEKKNGVGNIKRSYTAALEEIKKCEVLCPNCHAELHQE
jgi:hypothetical protein